MGLAIALLTISDTRTLQEDSSGDQLQRSIEDAGHQLHERALCVDDRYQIRAELSRWIADRAVDVVISSGVKGVIRVMRALEMIPSKKGPKAPRKRSETAAMSTWVRADIDGIMRPVARLEQPHEAGGVGRGGRADGVGTHPFSEERPGGCR